MSSKLLDVDLCSCVWDHNAIGGLNIQDVARLSNILLLFIVQRRQSHVTKRHCRLCTAFLWYIFAKPLAVTSAFARTTAEEINTVDIFVVSFYLEKLFVMCVCSMPVKLLLLFIQLCKSLGIRWCIGTSSAFAAILEYVQRWECVSKFCSQLWCEDLTPTFSDGSFCLGTRMPCMGALWIVPLTHGSPLLSNGWFMEVSNCKNFPENSPRTVICNIHNCDRCLFFRHFCVTSSFGTGRSILLLRIYGRTTLFHMTFTFLKV